MLRKLAVFVVVCCFASQAMALFEVGEVGLKLEDGSQLYRSPRTDNENAIGAAEPIDFGSATAFGERCDGSSWLGAELRSIWRATTYDVIKPDGTKITNIPAVPNPATEELTGISHGLYVRDMYYIASTTMGDMAVLHYAPMSASAIGPFTDTDDTTPSHLPAGSGGYVQAYFDTAKDFTADPDDTGPGTQPGEGDPSDDWDLTNPRYIQFPGSGASATSNLVGELVFTPLSAYGITMDGFANPLDPSVVMYAVVSTSSIIGQTSNVYLNIITDALPLNTRLGPNVPFDGIILEDWASEEMFGDGILGGDATFYSNLFWGNSRDEDWERSGWTYESNDPMTFYVIPEPTTMALLGCGLLGVLRRRRRK